MKRYKAGCRVSSFITSSILFLLLVAWVAATPSALAYEAPSITIHTLGKVSVQETPTADPTMTTLQKELLTQQIDQSKQQTEQLKQQNALSWTIVLTPISTSITILGTFVAAFFGFRRWRAEHRTDREKRDQDRFQSVVEALGGERMEQKVGGAVMLRTFLRPEYEQYYSQVFDLTVANLRIPESARKKENPDPDKPRPPTPLNQALATVFKDAFPLARSYLKERKKQSLSSNPQLLDATDIRLDGTYLNEVHLEEAYMPHSSLRGAHLERAHLERAHLEEAYLREADLTEAYLEGAHFERAHLEGAYLEGAHLEEAYLEETHLEGAYLMGAHLEGANPLEASLKDTTMREVRGLTADQLYYAYSFKGAIIDDSIIKLIEEHLPPPTQQPQGKNTQHQPPISIPEANPLVSTIETPDNKTDSNPGGAPTT